MMEAEGKEDDGEHVLELDGRTLTFEQFRDCCLKPNFPAVIRYAVPEGNESLGELFFSSLEFMRSRLSPTGLIHRFGEHHRVPTVETASSSFSVEEVEHMERHVRPLSEVMECWRQNEVLYLKDWHMQLDSELCAGSMKVTKEERETRFVKQQSVVTHGDGLYQVPGYLGDDWMDQFCRRLGEDATEYSNFGDKESDYRFAYIGPPSSWTPLHFDVFGTYSWSLNVCGEKLWFFPSPEGNQRLMENSIDGVMLPTDIRTTTDVELWTVLQRPGDLVFVPSGYLHQVHNVSGLHFPLPPRSRMPYEALVSDGKTGICNKEVGDTVALVISINHNWCNEWCVEKMVEAFCRDAKRIRRLLTDEDRILLFGDDIIAWRDHVERLLIGGTNWNFSCIRSFLKHRLASLNPQGDGGNDVKMELRHRLVKCLEKVDAVDLCRTCS